VLAKLHPRPSSSPLIYKTSGNPIMPETRKLKLLIAAAAAAAAAAHTSV